MGGIDDTDPAPESTEEARRRILAGQIAGQDDQGGGEARGQVEGDEDGGPPSSKSFYTPPKQTATQRGTPQRGVIASPYSPYAPQPPQPGEERPQVEDPNAPEIYQGGERVRMDTEGREIRSPEQRYQAMQQQFLAALPPAMRDHYRLQQLQLSTQEQAELQRQRNALTAIDQQNWSADDKATAKMMVQHGINVLAIRQAQAQVLHTELQNKQLQSQAEFTASMQARARDIENEANAKAIEKWTAVSGAALAGMAGQAIGGLMGDQGKGLADRSKALSAANQPGEQPAPVHMYYNPHNGKIELSPIDDVRLKQEALQQKQREHDATLAAKAKETEQARSDTKEKELAERRIEHASTETEKAKKHYKEVYDEEAKDVKANLTHDPNSITDAKKKADSIHVEWEAGQRGIDPKEVGHAVVSERVARRLKAASEEEYVAKHLATIGRHLSTTPTPVSPDQAKAAPPVQQPVGQPQPSGTPTPAPAPTGGTTPQAALPQGPQQQYSHPVNHEGWYKRVRELNEQGRRLLTSVSPALGHPMNAQELEDQVAKRTGNFLQQEGYGRTLPEETKRQQQRNALPPVDEQHPPFQLKEENGTPVPVGSLSQNQRKMVGDLQVLADAAKKRSDSQTTNTINAARALLAKRGSPEAMSPREKQQYDQMMDYIIRHAK